MANNNNRNARSLFLRELGRVAEEGPDIHTASDFGRSRAAQAFRLGDGVLALNQQPVDAAAWRAITGVLQQHPHPQHYNFEPLVVAYFDIIIDAVITAVNNARAARRQQQRLVAGGQENMNITRYHNHVTGQCGYVIWCGGRPCCIVEHKVHQPHSGRLFDQGRAQALVYAAAIGHQRGQTAVLAVVTDLVHWQFFNVTADGYEESDEYEVHYDQQTGLAQGNELEEVLERMVDLVLMHWNPN